MAIVTVDRQNLVSEWRASFNALVLDYQALLLLLPNFGDATVDFPDNAHFAGTVLVDGTLESGAATINGTLDVVGDAEVTGTLTVTVNLSVGGDIEAVNAALSGDLSAANIGASGNIVALGDISGVNGNFSGDVDAVNVVASGDVSGVNGNFSGDVSATGNVSGVDVNASGDVSGVNGNFSGDVDAEGNVSGVDVNASGDVSGVNGNFSGDVGVAGDVSVSGNIVGSKVYGSFNVISTNNTTPPIGSRNFITAEINVNLPNPTGLSVGASLSFVRMLDDPEIEPTITSVGGASIITRFGDFETQAILDAQAEFTFVFNGTNWEV